MTFTNNWTRMAHLGLPGNAHFSPVVAATHDGQYDLLPIGSVADKALEQVAELGRQGDLNKEVEAQIEEGHALDLVNTENMFLNQASSQTFEIVVSNKHEYLSFVSMIAPSPDWVVGLSNLKLHSEKDGFYQGVENQPLYAINAGTEEGDRGGNFSLNNRPTSPQTPIQILTGRGFEAPFAFVSITPLAE